MYDAKSHAAASSAHRALAAPAPPLTGELYPLRSTAPQHPDSHTRGPPSSTPYELCKKCGCTPLSLEPESTAFHDRRTKKTYKVAGRAVNMFLALCAELRLSSLRLQGLDECPSDAESWQPLLADQCNEKGFRMVAYCCRVEGPNATKRHGLVYIVRAASVTSDLGTRALLS